MTNITKINHDIIKSYIMDFANNNEISSDEQKDQHSIFEKYINNLILTNYCDDLNADYNDMEVNTAFGIDGVAIFVDDKFIINKEDVDLIIDEKKKFEVEFFFIQTKTTTKFERTNISDFFIGVRRFFNSEECDIPELKSFWEVKKYLYSKASKFKILPKLRMIYVTLSSKDKDEQDAHLTSAISLGIGDLNDLNLFSDIKIDFLGVKNVMALHQKIENEMQKTIKLDKQLIPFPKDQTKMIKNSYFGLVSLDEYIKLLIDDVENPNEIKKGVFNDNIRDYLGSNEKIEINQNMKNQLIGEQSYLFGLLNNGVTIISDEIIIASDEISLQNYQIVNGCQTSNVILEVLHSIKNRKDIFIPIKFISTEDEETKNAIIKGTNSQTELKAEQLLALFPIQKAIEEHYQTKNKISGLYYERRTGQYRNTEIPKSKIINIPFQIKCVAAFFFDLPHEVSGQYGKVEKQTRGKIFIDEHFSYLNCYYASGLAWYKIERFVNSTTGKKYKRARWHILMTFKYLLNDTTTEVKEISKRTLTYAEKLEKAMCNDEESNRLLSESIKIIDLCFPDISDRKIFEKQTTTSLLLKYLFENKLVNSFLKK